MKQLIRDRRINIAAAIVVVVGAVTVLVAFISRNPHDGPIVTLGMQVGGDQSMKDVSLRSAVTTASEAVEFPVRAPRHIPEGFSLTYFRVTAPEVDFGDGSDRPWLNTAVVGLRGADKRVIEITQFLPRDSAPFSLQRGFERLDVGLDGVEASFGQTDDSTYVQWRSEDAWYSGAYHNRAPEESDAALQMLVEVLRSMK